MSQTSRLSQECQIGIFPLFTDILCLLLKSFYHDDAIKKMIFPDIIINYIVIGFYSNFCFTVMTNVI